MYSPKHAARPLIAAGLLFVFAMISWAQATWGTISGFVTDPTGAAVPNANITITNERTGVQRRIKTDNGGLYNAPHLDPGQYTIRVEAGGFQSFVQQHVVLRVDSTARVDAKMVLGQASQEITVKSGLAELETQKTDVSTTISQHEIDNLPTVNHNVTRLYLDVPGVVPFSFQIGNVEMPSEGSMVDTNGQLWTANNFQMDGIDDLQFGWSGIQFIVPPENSIQELKITTNNFDPEYSSVGGMVAQFVTKSGTNELHGDAYWFNQNSAFSAANPFTEKVAGTGPKGLGTGPAYFNDNVGGASLGGPIIKIGCFCSGITGWTKD
jgi:Carboxypeptidase regulatory-like domain